MKKIQTQGVHHITLLGADRQTSIDFWEGVLGMPFIFEQPNLDVPEQNHLYFDPGDGRLITVFTNETYQVDDTPNPEGVGNVHHIAFIVSRATFTQAEERLNERGVKNTGEVDRGFMHSLYFRDPLGQLIELACYKFDPPVGVTHAEVLLEAHKLRVAQGDYNIADGHLADALELLTRRTASSLSSDRSAKNPYTRS
ncbi:MAG: VOC family protein [Chloroflexota bacterium]